MRVATWNLLHGIALVDPLEAPGLAQVAGSITADLIGLQEVDRHQERSNNEHQTKIVADAMGLPYWVLLRQLSAHLANPGKVQLTLTYTHMNIPIPVRNNRITALA